ncbi:MAG: SPOR domain-containing protein [Methylophilaceae bacterium]|jgi:DedD protein|nr:SPOR domain-containing protein [Methylophilaceae bacterium]
MSIDEQEIQFRKRARRRLVGAIALVLLMVTVLPMVLDDRSANLPQQEIEISIPSQDDDEFTSSVTPYNPEPETAVQAETLPETIPQDALATETPAVAEADAATAAKTPAPVVDNKSTPASKPIPVQSTAKSPSPTYSVQIGVFSDAANVRQLESKLKAQGLQPSTEKLQTAQGEKIRLRVGPFASRELAEEAMGKIKAASLSGMIITNK